LLTALFLSPRGITRDESMYPEPEAFNPGRWLSKEYPTYREPLTQYPNLNGYSQFGFGRRTCQGIPIVEQDLFLAMGGMAWAFDIRKRRDPATGAEIPVHWDSFTPLLIAKPVKFVFDAVPRGGESKLAMLRAMWEASEEEDEELVLKDDGSLEHVNYRRPREELSDDDGESESDHDVLINVRESSSEASEA
jgi:hypothetical protein